MKANGFRYFMIITSIIALAFTSLFFMCNCTFAQTYFCSARVEVDIPYNYNYFKTKILANAIFEIKFTIRDNTDNKVYVRLIPGTHDPDVTVDGKTLTYYLGEGLYSSTKTIYDVLGSSDDDIVVPGISQIFFLGSVADEEWIYDYDGGSARITDITISSDQAKIRYLEFYENEERTGAPHEDSQDFSLYNDLDESGWENLTLSTGAPAILPNEDVLYLTAILPIDSQYPPYSYPYYSGSYPGSFYGSYPWGYPGTSYMGGFYTGYPSSVYSLMGRYSAPYTSGFYGSFPSTNYSGFYGNYFGGFTRSYPYGLYGGYSSGFLGTYPSSYFSNYPFGAFQGLRSSFPSYGFGFPPFGVNF